MVLGKDILVLFPVGVAVVIALLWSDNGRAAMWERGNATWETLPATLGTWVEKTTT